MSILRRSARNFAAQTISFGISILDRIVLTGILIRIWGVESFSDWTTIWSAASLLVLAEFGFQTYLGNALVQAENRGHQRAFQRALDLGMTFYAGFTIVVVIGLAVTSTVIPLSQILRLRETGHDGVIAILFLYQMMRIARAGFSQVLRGKGAYHRLIMTDVRATGGSAALACCGVLLGAGPLVVSLLYLAGEVLLGTVWNLLVIRRLYPTIALRCRLPNRRQIKAAALELRWYSTFQFNSYVMAGLPILIIAWLNLGGIGLAGFAVQRTLVNFARTVAATFSAAIGVELATLDRRGAQNRLIEGVSVMASMNMALATLAGVGLFLYGQDLLTVWTGKGDLGSWRTLALLLIPVVAVAPAAPLTMLSLYAAKPRAQAIGTAVQMVTALPLCVILGRMFNIDGVAAALAIGEVIGIALVLPILSGPLFGIPLTRLFLRSGIVFVGTLGWSLAVSRVVTWLFGHGHSVRDRLAIMLVWGAISGSATLLALLPAPQRHRLMSSVRLRLL